MEEQKFHHFGESFNFGTICFWSRPRTWNHHWCCKIKCYSLGLSLLCLSPLSLTSFDALIPDKYERTSTLTPTLTLKAKICSLQSKLRNTKKGSAPTLSSYSESMQLLIHCSRLVIWCFLRIPLMQFLKDLRNHIPALGVLVLSAVYQFIWFLILVCMLRLSIWSWSCSIVSAKVIKKDLIVSHIPA